MQKASLWLGLLGFLAFVGLSGCGSSSPKISVALSPSSAQAVDQGQTVKITATVANDSQNKGVSWSLSGAGTLTNQTATGVTYDAPASVTAAATATVTATAVDSKTSTAQIKITVNPPPKVTTTSLPAASEYKSYSETLQASGGTGALSWKVSSGSLPSWATLNASTGVISGTPKTTGKTNFSVTVTDATSVTSAAQALSLTVNPPPPLAITTSSLPNGTAGTAYSATLDATGGVQPYSWSISSGTLPAWAKLDSSTGVISGMPNAAGTTNFTVKVTDSESPTVSVTKALSIVIAPAPALTISTSSLPNGNEGTAYTATLAATGGVTPYKWSISNGTLPSWATLDASTGVINGTPNATGTTNFTVQVTDSSATPVSTTKALSITINPAASPNNAELKGQYGFLLRGFDDSTGLQFAIGGSFTADGSGNVTGGIFDVQGPSPATAVSIASGSYSVGADNRGTLTLNGANGSSRKFAIAVGTLNSSKVATQAGMIEFDDTNGTTGDRGAGSIYLQDTTAFALSSFKGPYAFQTVGDEGTPGTRLVDVGAFTADGNGNITNGELDSNATGTVSNGSFSFTASATANTSTYGRLSFVLSGGGTGSGAMYIISAGHLLMLTGSTAGEVFQQSSTSFSTSSLSGTLVFDAEGLGSTAGDSDSQLGLLTIVSTGSATFLGDENDSGTTTTNSATVGYTVASNGRVTITGGTEPPIFYLITNNEAFAVSTDPHADAGFAQPQSAGPFSNASISGTYFFKDLPPAVTGTPVNSGVATSTGNGTLSATQDVSGPGGVLTTGQSLSFTLSVSSNGRGTDNQGDIYYIISPTKIVSMNSTSTTGSVTVAQQ